MLMYVGGVVLLRNFPFVEEARLAVLTRFRERAMRSFQTTDRVGLVNATPRRSLRLLCGEYGQIKRNNLCAIWSRNHGERSMYRRDGEKLNCRDGQQVEHFSARQGAEQAGFSAQNGSEGAEDSCRRAGDVPDLWSRADDAEDFWSRASAPGRAC